MRGKGQGQGDGCNHQGITPAYAGKSSAAAAARICARDHPRVCGEKGYHNAKLKGVLGSPPRVQGKGRPESHRPPTAGITPAYAGKSCPPQAPTFTRQDHPRVCGEKRQNLGPHTARKGSPPRMRGKVNQYVHDELRLGITPACAGKRRQPVHRATPRQDHPRVCGEKFFLLCCCAILKGSPPRMRGKGLWLVADFVFLGITPAYAGKSLSETSIRPRLEDHPRVCGEKRRNGLQRTNPSGSPPRMRGKGRRWPESVAANGITPAYAGKSLCGLCLCRSRLGSPPRMRGKERLAKNQRSVHGITPAYAGKRKVCDGSRHETRDHPRVCGEKIISMLKASFGAGSPPRMRGKGTTTETDK